QVVTFDALPEQWLDDDGVGRRSKANKAAGCQPAQKATSRHHGIEMPFLGRVSQRKSRVAKENVSTEAAPVALISIFLLPEQPELRRIARGLGEAEVTVGMGGQETAARRALDEALLNHERLDDLLDGVARLGEGPGRPLHSNPTPPP